MSDLLMTIGEGLTVLVDYDYEPEEAGDEFTPPVPQSVGIYLVLVGDSNILNILSEHAIETIEQNIFDSFDKELQEPDDEYVEG
jgi:hypothetical protein